LPDWERRGGEDPEMSRLGSQTPDRLLWVIAAAILILGVPGLASAAATEGHGRSGSILFGLAVLVLAAKTGGLLADRLGQPSVLGELLVGIGLGHFLPLLFGQRGIAFVRAEPTLFTLVGIAAPLLLGWGAAIWLMPDSPRWPTSSSGPPCRRRAWGSPRAC
jgi:hypothetical protein